jgi:hypothetical protein
MHSVLRRRRRAVPPSNVGGAKQSHWGMAEQVRRHRNSNATRLLLIEKFHAGSSGTVEAHPGDQGASENREIQRSMNSPARQDTRNKYDLVG